MDHHWQEGREPDPDHHFGFVYEIAHLSTGRKYIGYKQYWFSSGKVKYRVKDIKSSKWNKLAWKPSDWRDYTSSSKDLNTAIAEFGKDDFEFRILGQYTNSRDMRYQEVRQLVLRDAVTLVDSDGAYVYYNKSIPDIKFRPPTVVSEETREKMSKSMMGTGRGNTHAQAPCFDTAALMWEQGIRRGPLGRACKRCGADDWWVDEKRANPAGFSTQCRPCNVKAAKKYREKLGSKK